jgi:hypothetical protein
VYSNLPRAANSRDAGYFTNSGTRASYGVYSTTGSTGTDYGISVNITGAVNTGYTGYFSNTARSGVNYGVHGINASASGYGGYFKEAYPAASGATKCCDEASRGVIEHITNLANSGGSDDRLSPLVDRVPGALCG